MREDSGGVQKSIMVVTPNEPSALLGVSSYEVGPGQGAARRRERTEGVTSSFEVETEGSFVIHGPPLDLFDCPSVFAEHVKEDFSPFLVSFVSLLYSSVPSTPPPPFSPFVGMV